MYAIRRRSTKRIVESGFNKREEAKPVRDKLNCIFYKVKKIEDIKAPIHLREYYVVRGENHPKGTSI